MARGFCWLTLSLGLALQAAQPIRDESVRRQVLTAVFPSMQISTVSGRLRPSNKPKPGVLIFFPDALGGEHVYRITGPPSGETERCAAEDMASSAFKQSNIRELSFVLHRWPRRPDLLAIVQYRFVGANPGGSCWSIGRLLHLTTSGDSGWRVVEELEFDTQHHSGFERIELADLDGNGVDELLLESDWGGAAIVGSNLHIFSLQDGRFERWLHTTARVQGIEESSIQMLDIPQTKATNGKLFCFSKTDFAGPELQVYRTPRVSRPCYPRETNATPQ